MDEAGNTLANVDVPVTGTAMWRAAVANITPEQIIDFIENGTRINGMNFLGLFMPDGGPAEETDGAESIEFFQKGYGLEGGNVSARFTVTCAETNAAVHRSVGFSTRSTGDMGTQGRAYRQALVYDTLLTGIVLVRNRNGRVTARWGIMRPVAANIGKYERGQVITYEITFEWVYWEGVETVDDTDVPFDRGLYQWLVWEPGETPIRGALIGEAARALVKKEKGEDVENGKASADK